MSYTPTNWSKGDVVTSAKLNKLEQGVADAGDIFVVTFNTDNTNWTADKTCAETKAAIESGKRVFASLSGSGDFFEMFLKEEPDLGQYLHGTVSTIAPPTSLFFTSVDFAEEGGTDYISNESYSYTLTPAT